MDVIISPVYVKLSKEGTSSKAVDCLGNEWGDVAVFLGPTVDRVIVLNWTELAVFLFDKEEVCGIGAPQLSDGASLQVFGYKLVDLLYFELGERK